MKRFAGNVTDWPAFWEGYKIAVHGSRSLSEVEKFTYLLSYLDGSAHKAVSGLALTSEGYKIAIDTLKDRF